MGYNLNIDTTRAVNWRKDVETEFVAVKATLDLVRAACEESPDEDDPLMSTIREVGNSMSQAWDKLTNSFNSLQNDLGNAIELAIKKRDEEQEKLRNLNKTVSNNY